jgi:peptidyl-tRNA hydrolase, PTH2 family
MESTVGVQPVPWYESINVSIWEIIFIVALSMVAGYFLGSYSIKKLIGRKKRSRSSPDTIELLGRNLKQELSNSEDDYDGVDDNECKMVLVVRTDLDMGKGKAAAQCCHACLAAYKSSLRNGENVVVKTWEAQGQPKITLKCSSEEELMDLYSQAAKSGLVARYIQDAGRTQIAAGSKTVLAIGPNSVHKINSVTGHLKLY